MTTAPDLSPPLPDLIPRESEPVICGGCGKTHLRSEMVPTYPLDSVEGRIILRRKALTPFALISAVTSVTIVHEPTGQPIHGIVGLVDEPDRPDVKSGLVLSLAEDEKDWDREDLHVVMEWPAVFALIRHVAYHDVDIQGNA